MSIDAIAFTCFGTVAYLAIVLVGVFSEDYDGGKLSLFTRYRSGEAIPWMETLYIAFWPACFVGVALLFVGKFLIAVPRWIWGFLRFPFVNRRRLRRQKVKPDAAPRDGAYR